MAMASDEAFQQLKEMAREPAERVRNEADTRHKVIDFILHNILAWPTNRVSVEEYIRPGYADYVLKRTNDDPIILVEAKKEGRFFELPAPHDPTETCAYISLDKLMSDVTIKDAVTQVRQYCIDVGCEYAAITNGYEWVLFKTFEPSRRWELTKAFVIRRLLFFEVEFTRAFNALSYAAISERSSLSSLLTSNPPKDRSIYYPKEKVPSYSHPVTANRLASHLRPLVNQYFGVIGDDDPEFMKRCYVTQRDHGATLSGMRSLIQDALSPLLHVLGLDLHGLRCF